MKWLLSFVMVFGLTACVQAPTQTTQTLDDRPRLAFDEQLIGEPVDYEVVIDGISYGPLSQYLVNENALRIVEGTHRIEILENGRRVFSTEVFLGASTTRVINVVAHD